MPALLKSLGDQTTGTTVLQVACGGAHTIALVDNGDVYTWGSNDEMQLGLGSTFGRKVNRPELVAELGNKGVLRVAAGKNFSMALTESGDVYSWGAGGSLQLGHGSKLNEEVCAPVASRAATAPCAAAAALSAAWKEPELVWPASIAGRLAASPGRCRRPLLWTGTQN